MNNDKDNDTILKKLEIYFLRQSLLHIDCFDGRFYNGVLIEVNDVKEFVILNDRKLGEIPILLEEIKTIEPYVREVKE